MIDKPGTYKVKTALENIRTIEIVQHDGELGVFFRMLGSFLPVGEFIGVEVICRIDQ